MTNIDLETGLPALKEGQFWRVRERQPDLYNHFESPYSVVELVERVEGEYRDRRQFLGINLWYGPPYKTIEESVLAYQVMWDPERPFNGADKNAGWIVTVDDARYYPVPGERITPSMILEAAKKALEWYESKTTAQKLLGDYPPKKLPIDA